MAQQTQESGEDVPLAAHTADQLNIHKEKELWHLAWILLAVFLGGEMLVLALWRRN